MVNQQALGLIKNLKKFTKTSFIFALFSPILYASSIKDLPKAELHLHLTGSYPLSYLKKISLDHASILEYKKLTDHLKVVANGVDYNDVFKYFLPVEKIVNTYQKVEDGVVALAEELLADNVVYVEIRTGLKDLGAGYEEYLCAILRGIKRSPQNITIKLLLSLRRNTTPNVVKQTVDLAIKYKKQGVVGIDISGDSTLGEIDQLTSEIYRAKKSNLYLALHIGESAKEIDSLEKQQAQSDILEQLQPDRLGHGVYLSSQAIQWLLNHPQVPLEICPSSSVMAGMIDHHSKHPGIEYYLHHNHPVVISTDDPLLFQTNLTNEFTKIMELDGINVKEVMRMNRWAFDFAFIPQSEKLTLIKKYFR